MGFVPDYYKLGKAAASVVDRHQKGEGLQNIPVATDEEPTLLINRATARLLNVTIPEGLLGKAIRGVDTRAIRIGRLASALHIKSGR